MGSIPSELLMCGGGVHIMLLLPLVARCLETINVCTWRMFVFMSVVVTVGMFVVKRALVKIVIFSLGVLKYILCLCMGCDGWCAFCLYWDAWSCRCSCVESMCVSPGICCMFVVSAFISCSGLSASSGMLWMCALYVSVGSNVRPITFEFVAMGSAVLFILRSRLLLNSAGSGVNRVPLVLSGFIGRVFCVVQANTLCNNNNIYLKSNIQCI